MAYSKEDVVARARADLAARLGVSESEVQKESVEQADFPNTSLGAPARDEMSGMMITSGWRIRLSAAGKSYEYRADRNQVRLYNFDGKNYKIRSEEHTSELQSRQYLVCRLLLEKKKSKRRHDVMLLTSRSDNMIACP